MAAEIWKETSPFVNDFMIIDANRIETRHSFPSSPFPSHSISFIHLFICLFLSTVALVVVLFLSLILVPSNQMFCRQCPRRSFVPSTYGDRNALTKKRRERNLNGREPNKASEFAHLCDYVPSIKYSWSSVHVSVCDADYLRTKLFMIAFSTLDLLVISLSFPFLLGLARNLHRSGTFILIVHSHSASRNNLLM